jgi:hypothetical protein
VVERKSRHEQEARFRGWIIERLKETRWLGFIGDDWESVSKRLGVRPEILVEAQRSLDEEYRELGRHPKPLGQDHLLRRMGPRCRCEILLPWEVYEDWLAYCRARQLSKSVLLRSVIHRMLSVPTQPGHVGKGWIYRGQALKACCKRNIGRGGKRGRLMTSISTELTHGAHEALVRRARKSGVPCAGLLRGAVLDLLEGRTKQLVVMSRVDELWDDPTRYWTLDQVNHG